MFELRRSPGTRSDGPQAGPLVERRFVATGLEVRADGDDDAMVVEGYAAKFDKETVIWRYVEVIRKGAFSRAVKEDDVRALFNHDPNLILGRTKSGTLDLSEDETGLRCVITLPRTEPGRNLYESIQRGDVDQMSFAFVVVKEVWTNRELQDGTTQALRELVEVKLYDVSPVTYPAYEDTEIGVRELEVLVEARRADGSLSDESRAVLEGLLQGSGVVTEQDPAADLAARRRRLDLVEVA